jgi:putative peptidoglycan lipid II flippase
VKLSAVILTAQLSERVLTLLLTAMMARWLGASKALDMGLLALAVPNALGDLFETISYVSLLPFFARERTEQGDTAAWRLANKSLNAIVIGLAALLLLYLALLPVITRLMATGYSAEEVRATVRYGLVAGAIILFRGVGGSVASFLMVHNAVWPAFGRFIARGTVRIALFFVLHQRGWGVMAFVAATTVSDAAAVVFCAAGVRRIAGVARYRFRELLPVRVLLHMLSHVASQAVIGGVNATVLILERSFASGVSAGSVAIVNYTRGIALLPLMAGRSMTAGLYPRLAEHAAQGRADLGATVWRGLRAVLFTTVPLTVAFFVLRDQLVALFYRRGQFTADDAAQVSALMPYYLAACLVWSVSFLASRALFAAMKTALVARLELLTWFLYIAAVAYLTPRLGVIALGLSFAIRVLASTVLVVGAAARAGILTAERPTRYCMEVALGAFVVGAGSWAGQAMLRSLVHGGGTLTTAAVVVAGFVGGALAFLPFALVAHRSEMRHLLGFLRGLPKRSGR